MGTNLKTTILLTTFNRGDQLRNSLDRMTHLTLADDYLVVDDGSTDNTEEVVNSFKDKLPIRYIYNHNPDWSICSFARNIGIKNSDTDVIITSEPEILWITDVVPQILADMESHPNELISAGVIYHAQPNTTFHPGLITNTQEALESQIVEDYQTEPRSYNPSGYCKTVNMQATFIAAYKRSWLMELGGWDEAFPGAYGFDDIELCTRLRINGINQFIDPTIEALHQFHPHLPPHIQGPMVAANDNYFASKKLGKVEEDIFEQKRLGTYTQIDPRLIANKDVEWGVIHAR